MRSAGRTPEAGLKKIALRHGVITGARIPGAFFFFPAMLYLSTHNVEDFKQLRLPEARGRWGVEVVGTCSSSQICLCYTLTNFCTTNKGS